MYACRQMPRPPPVDRSYRVYRLTLASTCMHADRYLDLYP